MKRTIRKECIIPYPPEIVWRAVSDRGLLAAWFMDNDFEPKLHHPFTFRKKPQPGWDGITHCEVIEFDPPRRVAFSYRGKASGEKTLRCAGLNSSASKAGKGLFMELDTVLRFTVFPECDSDQNVQSRFVLEHSGFKGIKLVLVSFIMAFGWQKLLRDRLPQVLEREFRETYKLKRHEL